jgi:hypothetical protein
MVASSEAPTPHEVDDVSSSGRDGEITKWLPSLGNCFCFHCNKICCSFRSYQEFDHTCTYVGVIVQKENYARSLCQWPIAASTRNTPKSDGPRRCSSTIATRAGTLKLVPPQRRTHHISDPLSTSSSLTLLRSLDHRGERQGCSLTISCNCNFRGSIDGVPAQFRNHQAAVVSADFNVLVPLLPVYEPIHSRVLYYAQRSRCRTKRGDSSLAICIYQS